MIPDSMEVSLDAEVMQGLSSVTRCPCITSCSISHTISSFARCSFLIPHTLPKMPVSDSSCLEELKIILKGRLIYFIQISHILIVLLVLLKIEIVAHV